MTTKRVCALVVKTPAQGSCSCIFPPPAPSLGLLSHFYCSTCQAKHFAHLLPLNDSTIRAPSQINRSILYWSEWLEDAPKSFGSIIDVDVELPFVLSVGAKIPVPLFGGGAC